MFDFHAVTVDDEKLVSDILLKADRVSCEYAFANIFMWAGVYHTQIAVFDNMVIVRSTDPYAPDTSPYSYLYPVGNGDRVKAINEMMAETKAIGRALQIYSVSKTDKEWMEENFKDVFEFEYSRDECDYVYASEALQNLQGKKMQKKRNHVAKFLKQNPDFVTEKITKENISEVIAFDNKWAKLTDNVGDKGIAKEHKAVDLVLENYFKLPLEGCLIRVDEKIIAFSYGSAISDKVFCTHVEKALYEVEGAYNIINREFARLFCKDYLYINREDDVGSEGLRKAKLSYKPEFLEEKYIAVLKGRKTECFV